jgi:hypothetical protein
MKKIAFILLLTMVTIYTADAGKYRHNRRPYTITVQTFYNELAPYGDWIYTPEYGYVWSPYFDYPEAFRPYSSNGYWVNTDYGWTWVSGYRWGWATFHYGRWTYDDYIGWLWIPGYDWAPAWVTWGMYDNYWGWAPLGPDGYIYSHTGWMAPDRWWTFVPRNRFCATNWNSYIFDRTVRVSNITYITNVYNDNSRTGKWYYGPRVNEVERYSKTKVRKVEIRDSDRSSNNDLRNNRLDIYRPTIDPKREQARPTEYRNADQVRPTRRLEPAAPKRNDPGVNRTRVVESREQREVNVNREPSERKENTIKTDPVIINRERKSTGTMDEQRENRTTKQRETNARTQSGAVTERQQSGTELKKQPTRNEMPGQQTPATTRTKENRSSTVSAPANERQSTIQPRQSETPRTEVRPENAKQNARSTEKPVRK